MFKVCAQNGHLWPQCNLFILALPLLLCLLVVVVIVVVVVDIATVIAPYQATGPEQLSLQPGQFIDVRKKNPSGWWEGELQVVSFSHRFSEKPSLWLLSARLSFTGTNSGYSTESSGKTVYC